MRDYKNGIYCVDSGYEVEGLAAIHIILSNGRAAIVDTANNASITRLTKAMDELDIALTNVDYIFLTHIHLDHAGGAGLFMREMPCARLVVHERGARHMINPEKLIQGTVEVYGKSKAERLYGEIIPVPSERVVVPSDGDEIQIGGRTIVCMDTPGHARHHLAFYDTSANAVFAGDAFGLSCFEFSGRDRSFVMPTTSPVQFDPDAMHRSIDRIISTRADHLYITHFGEIAGQSGAASDLHRLIDDYIKIAQESSGDVEQIKRGLETLFREEVIRHGETSSPDMESVAVKSTVDLNASGLAVWYAKQKNV
ncbi:MAG: MBL fold metallo-hydrolase [Synergistaceae bacterium]|nr:MBL fold metallo-hydrolase [Synergistaceae bacterium]